MGHRRNTPQICKDCGSEKVRGFHNKFKCVSKDCIVKRKAYMKQYSKKHWSENKDKIKEDRANWSPERKDANAEYLRNYVQENKERLSAHAKQFRQENAERINEQRAGYREQNRDLLNERQKDYYQRNQEERLEYAKNFRDEKMAPYYKMWESIVQRCTNPKAQAYPRYGFRGINIHKDWLESYSKFEEYIESKLGSKPSPKHSLDRINNEGHYEPGNIKWSSPLEQAHNKTNSLNRKTRIPDNSPIYYQNRYMTLDEFSNITNIHPIVVKYRYAHCVDADYILNWKNDNRNFLYNNHLYNIAELSLISKIRYNILFDRIINCGLDVEKAMSIKR